MIEKINAKLLARVDTLIQHNPDAINFINLYRDYIHFIDDLVDIPDKRTPESILEMAAKANQVFSCCFWREHGPILSVLELMINNTYADSIIWETSIVKWKISDASALRHCGIDMFFAVILIVCGREALRNISEEFRAQAHLLHMDDNFQPV